MFTLMPYVWANGGRFLSEDGTRAMIDDPRTVETVQFLADLANKYKVTAPAGPPGGCAAQGDAASPISFDQGTVAMAPRASTVLGKYMQAKPSASVKIVGPDLGVALLPGKTPGRHSTFIGGDLIAISANSRHPDEAWNAVQYGLSADVQVGALAARGGFVPVRSDLMDDPIFDINPHYRVFVKALDVGYTPFTRNYNDLYAPFHAGIKAALAGEKPVVEALRAANAEMQKVIDAK